MPTESEYETKFKDAEVAQKLTATKHRRQLFAVHLVWIIVLVIFAWLAFMMKGLDDARQKSSAAERRMSDD